MVAHFRHLVLKPRRAFCSVWRFCYSIFCVHRYRHGTSRASRLFFMMYISKMLIHIPVLVAEGGNVRHMMTMILHHALTVFGLALSLGTGYSVSRVSREFGFAMFTGNVSCVPAYICCAHSRRRCQFFGTLDGLCEMTTIFLNFLMGEHLCIDSFSLFIRPFELIVLILLMSYFHDFQSASMPYLTCSQCLVWKEFKVPSLVAPTGFLLWLTWIPFRLFLFPYWFYSFYTDSKLFPR